jgi:catechol 2,3-dioxygenase-like lactoylglutathione lyase family enzyme
MVRDVWHFSFTVKDLERSIAFYRDVLGMQLIHRQEQGGGYTDRLIGFPNSWIKAAMFAFPDKEPGVSGHVLELVEYVEPRGAELDLRTCNTGVAHIAFVVDDLWQEYDRLRKLGVRFKSEPVDIVGGRNKGGKAVYMTDPDGITLELFEPPPHFLGRGS